MALDSEISCCRAMMQMVLKEFGARFGNFLGWIAIQGSDKD